MTDTSNAPSRWCKTHERLLSEKCTYECDWTYVNVRQPKWTDDSETRWKLGQPDGQ